LGRAANLTEKSVPKIAPPDTDGIQGWAEIKLQVNGNSERLVVDPRVTQPGADRQQRKSGKPQLTLTPAPTLLNDPYLRAVDGHEDGEISTIPRARLWG
jgi:hypothetical protein